MHSSHLGFSLVLYSCTNFAQGVTKGIMISFFPNFVVLFLVADILYFLFLATVLEHCHMIV